MYVLQYLDQDQEVHTNLEKPHAQLIQVAIPYKWLEFMRLLCQYQFQRDDHPQRKSHRNLS